MMGRMSSIPLSTSDVKYSWSHFLLTPYTYTNMSN